MVLMGFVVFEITAILFKKWKIVYNHTIIEDIDRFLYWNIGQKNILYYTLYFIKKCKLQNERFKTC